MLGQVWKNIAGKDFPALVSDSGVQVLTPKGCQYRICDFAKLISRVEDALERKLCVKALYAGDGEMLLNIYIDERVEDAAPKKATPKKKKVETPQEAEQEE